MAAPSSSPACPTVIGTTMTSTCSRASRGHWNNNDLDMLKSITASSFDVVLMNPVYTPSNVPTGPSPAVASFTADPMTVSAGQPVTLSWNVTGAIYNIVSPQVGPVRGT